MDKVTANNLKRNLDESRKIWAKYPAQCESASKKWCAHCDYVSRFRQGANLHIQCQFLLAPVTATSGLPCQHYSHTV